VLAVASGVVLAAVDDMPDSDDVPNAPSPRFPLERASGNYVALALAGGPVAFYEHLAAGSVRVRAGDSVSVGDVIAALGYSGSSSIGPHLHFHVSDAPSLLSAEGVPFVFRSYREAGSFRSIGDFVAGERWSGSERERRASMPGPNSVLRFGVDARRE
jgi:murein DD-endopeptidase MepM/ murein hydrolase activator NlpD